MITPPVQDSPSATAQQEPASNDCAACFCANCGASGVLSTPNKPWDTENEPQKAQGTTHTASGRACGAGRLPKPLVDTKRAHPVPCMPGPGQLWNSLNVEKNSTQQPLLLYASFDSDAWIDLNPKLQVMYSELSWRNTSYPSLHTLIRAFARSSKPHVGICSSGRQEQHCSPWGGRQRKACLPCCSLAKPIPAQTNAINSPKLFHQGIMRAMPHPSPFKLITVAFSLSLRKHATLPLGA